MTEGGPRWVRMVTAVSVSTLLGYCRGYAHGRRSTTDDCYSNLARIAGSANLPSPPQLSLEYCDGIRLSNQAAAHFPCGSVGEAKAWLNRARENAAEEFRVDRDPNDTLERHFWIRSPQCATCEPVGELIVESALGTAGGALTCRVAFYGRSKTDFWIF